MAAPARGRWAFLAGLVVATVIAAVDTAIGGVAVLIGTLVAAPLIAGAGAGPRRTASVALYALALALALGTVNDFFGSGDHLFRAATVGVGGALALWIAALRDRRERDSRRLAVQYGVARILSEADTLEHVAPRLLEAVAVPLGWQVGGMWEKAGAEGDGLRRTAKWYAPGVDVPEFDAMSRELELRLGMGLPGRAWERRELVWVRNVQADPNFPRAEVASASGLQGGVAVPIVSSGEVVAVIEFFARDSRPPDDDLQRVMSAVAAQVGEFVEAVRAQVALRTSEARKAAMLESALDGVISMDHRGRVVEFNQGAERIFGYRQEDVVGREMAELVIPPSLRDRHRAALRRFVETEEPTILGRRLELPGMRSDGTEFPVELAITRIGDHSPPTFTGYVRDITERKRAEGEREELLRLEQVARVDAMQARDQLEAILSGVADGVTAQAPDGDLIFANQAAVETMGYSSAEELLAAPLSEVTSRFEVLDEDGRPFPLDRLPGRQALDGQAAEAICRFRLRETGEERWSQVKATPIRNERGDVVMAINVIEDITDQKRAQLEQEFLAESSRILGSSLDPDVTLREVANLAVPEIADWCVVDLLGPEGSIERVALAHTDPERLKFTEELQQEYPPDPNAPRGVPQVMRTGEPEMYEEIPDEMLVEAAVDERHLKILREFGFGSVVIVPMAARGRTVGALTFVTGRSGRRYSPSDLELPLELGRRCGVAIENARLYGERTYIARTLQQSLLPAELPDIPGLETAARFRATGEGNEVGGDFYDLFQTGADGWTVVVGDVCGKGPDAAAITALARYTLRAAAMRQRLPSESLRMLNEALLRQRTDRRFCTVAYAYVEPENGGAQIGLSSGGHPLPLLLRPDGEVLPLGAHGTLLGVVPDPDLQDRAAVLESGDALVFYTDGVTEARGPGGAMGEDRLAEVVRDCAGLDADGIAGRVEGAALGMQEGMPRDDIAVVVLRLPA